MLSSLPVESETSATTNFVDTAGGFYVESLPYSICKSSWRNPCHSKSTIDQMSRSDEGVYHHETIYTRQDSSLINLVPDQGITAFD